MVRHIVVEAWWDRGLRLLDSDLPKHRVVPTSDDGTTHPLLGPRRVFHGQISADDVRLNARILLPRL